METSEGCTTSALVILTITLGSLENHQQTDHRDGACGVAVETVIHEVAQWLFAGNLRQIRREATVASSTKPPPSKAHLKEESDVADRNSDGHGVIGRQQTSSQRRACHAVV